MSLTKSAHATALHRAEPITAQRLKAWALRIGATSFFLAGTMALTATRIEATRCGYDLKKVHSEVQQLESDVGRLEVELANLARPQRVAELARRLGLSDPRSDQIIVMDD